MKILIRGLSILLVLGAAYGALNYFASERVEVVTLHTLDDKGQPRDVRLWVIDHEGAAYLRTKNGSGWYTQIQAQPNFEVTRGASRERFTGAPEPELRELINRGMRSKYGWGDAFISFTLGGRDDAIALRLVPASERQ